ncbi:MAG: hypothetical protein PHR84_03900 [Candidatus Omnitrophica bacterium]|jgi:hypothetical protein|nr:hypothetical protein [Candidatus Omnitrophota bacterium]
MRVINKSIKSGVKKKKYSCPKVKEVKLSMQEAMLASCKWGQGSFQCCNWTCPHCTSSSSSAGS